MDNQALYDFIVRSKAATYVGSGEPAPACRPGSHDLKFEEKDWAYLDSYFGGGILSAKRWSITRVNPPGP